MNLQQAAGKSGSCIRGLERSRALAFLLPLVGLAVLLWGTAYKTSLYRAPEIGRAPAKLCTRASDASKAELEQAVRIPPASTLPAVVLVAFYHAFVSAGPLVSPVVSERDDHTPLYLRMSPALFHRPPPCPWTCLT